MQKFQFLTDLILENQLLKIIPFYAFYVSFIISLVIARKGLSNSGLVLDEYEVYIFSISLSLLASISTYILLLRNIENIKKNGVESAFAITDDYFCFCYGFLLMVQMMWLMQSALYQP